MENYIYKLREYNLKATPQRIAITEALDIYGHLSIEQLYEYLKKKFNSLSLATIYKNLHIMMDNAFISEVKLPEKKSVYELTKEAHSHLLCKNCNAVVDIDIDIDDILNQAKQKSNFEIEKTSIVFSGLCPNCK
jgi:Fur family peroxide stress response transcriptional regulator